MIEINETNHALVLNASLQKSFNYARLNGVLNSEDVYLFNVLYNLINECNITITREQRKQLECLYHTLYNYSKDICKVKTVKGYPVELNTKFIVADKNDAVKVLTPQKVSYWQEPLGVTYQDILDLITEEYLASKEAATKEAFEIGVDAEYTDIGLIAFAINCSEEDTIYEIYDVLGNKVTQGFLSYYLPDLKTRVFIGINIYSIGIINFKIIET